MGLPVGVPYGCVSVILPSLANSTVLISSSAKSIHRHKAMKCRIQGRCPCSTRANVVNGIPQSPPAVRRERAPRVRLTMIANGPGCTIAIAPYQIRNNSTSLYTFATVLYGNRPAVGHSPCVRRFSIRFSSASVSSDVRLYRPSDRALLPS